MEKGIQIALIGILFSGFFMGISLSEERSAVTYEKRVKAIIHERCGSCHGSDAPTLEDFEKNKEGFKRQKKGPRMDTYENLLMFVNGKETGALMRRLDDGRNTKEGKPGNMYTTLGETQNERTENLELIKKWVGGWTLKRKGEISEAERKAIIALEK